MRARDSQFRSSMRRSAEAVRAQERTLKSLRRTVYRTNQRFRQFRSSVLSLRGAVGVLAGSAGLGLIIKRSLDTADSIAKTADAVGISTAALQELRFAADLSGVSIDGLDKALKFATKSIGELRTRTSSELTTALKDFDAQLMSNIKNAGSVEEALNLTFKRMGELEDATKKAAVAKAVFGRAGIDLVNIVRGGAGALEEMRREAQRLGIVIDDDLLRKSERAKDSLTILSTVLRTRVTRAVVENAEKIDRLAQALTEASSRGVGCGQPASSIFRRQHPSAQGDSLSCRRRPRRQVCRPDHQGRGRPARPIGGCGCGAGSVWEPWAAHLAGCCWGPVPSVILRCGPKMPPTV